MQLGPTIYPLVFACIAGRTLKTIALWKVERGTSVAVVEKLLGSHTVINTIGNAISLRSYDILTVTLLILWALSTIGGQGSLRLLYETNSTNVVNGLSVTCATPDLTIPGIDDPSSELWASWLPLFSIEHIVTASLTVSDSLKNNSVDPWGRSKAPSLDQIDGLPVTGAAESPWVSAVHGVDTTYASHVGLGVHSGIPSQGGTLEFVVPYGYLHFIWPAGSSAPEGPAHPNVIISNNTTELDPWGPLHSPRRTRTGGVLLANFFLSAVSRDLQVENTTNSTTASLLLGLFGEAGVSIYECSLRVISVDALVKCNAQNCVTDAIRSSNTNRFHACSVDNNAAFIMDLAIPFSPPLQRFSQFFPTSMSGVNENNSPIYEYLKGDPPLPSRNGLYPELTNWTAVSDEKLSSRLTTMLNTFWYAWLWSDEVYTNAYDETRSSSTSATSTKVTAVYKINKRWAVALFISSTILLILGAINCYYTFKLRVPDPFGYIWTLLRDGVNSNVPKTSSALSGDELARLLARETVQLTDVRPEDEAGMLALRVVAKGE
ncbi:hypothetical protein EK21DRAFT_112628 [Setomelanomma holmii]|uniref:Uncharacterized protein n=1 Tax=Setomelanomma holmii TaxID=210430 RepID=A0A9P4H921_9PLEO|nr:hypothetical protein EK21DRAFT_112628 [Setomelanomma holmii]